MMNKPYNYIAQGRKKLPKYVWWCKQGGDRPIGRVVHSHNMSLVMCFTPRLCHMLALFFLPWGNIIWLYPHNLLKSDVVLTKAEAWLVQSSLELT